jgi:hypothetical protein
MIWFAEDAFIAHKVGRCAASLEMMMVGGK